MRKIGLTVAVIIGLIVVAGYGLAVYGPPEVRTLINKIVQIGVPEANPRTALDDAIRKLPPGYTASYKTAEYDVVTDTLTVGGVAVHTADGVDISIDAIAVVKPSKNLDTAWAQAAANPAQIPQDKGLPVASVINVKGVKFHVNTFDASMGSVRVEGLRLYPWALLHSGVPGLAEAMAKAAAANPDSKPEDLQPLLRAEAAILLGLGYDRYVVETMHISGQTVARPSAPAMTVVYDFRKFEGAGYERASGGSGAGEGISAQLDDKGVLTIGRVAIAGLEARKPLTQVLESPALVPEMLDGLALGKIEYADMTFTPTGASAIPIGTLSISKIAFTGSVPVSGDLTFAGLKLAKQQIPDPKAQEAFEKLGLDTMTMSFGLSYRWDLATKRVTVTDLRYKVDELGGITVSVEVGELTPSIVGMLQGQLVHVIVRYDDGSGIERAFKLIATENQAEPAAFRQQMIEMIQGQAQLLGDSPEIAAGVKALVAFLQAPKNLTVELSPAQPVPFMTLQGLPVMPPPQVAQLLGLKVMANQ